MLLIHAPITEKKVKGKSSPWLTCELKKENDDMLVKLTFHHMKKNEVNFALGKATSTYFKNFLNENKKLPREFWKALKKIYPVKSGGCGHAKNSDKEISSSLCYMINRSINTGVFSSSCKITQVTPVCKSGSVNEAENYRPFLILSAVSKEMEKEVHKQFSAYN